jgi:regulation of enolase protein 1 (concanavalin A-like superfamily)
MLRLAYFPPGQAALAGAMAAAPAGKGFPVRFTEIRAAATPPRP